MATITKRKWKTGKGEQREAWVLAYTDAAGARRKQQFEKKRDADARRVEVEGQIVGGTYRHEAATKSVDDAVTDYLNDLIARRDRGEHVTEHYYKTTKAQLLNYVAPQPGRAISFDGGIGGVKLSQCTARTISDFRDRLRDAGVGVVTTRRILGSLSRALTYAVSKDMMAANPAATVRVTGKRGEGAKKVVPPTKDALAAVIKAADINFALKIKFAAVSGLRASEMHALTWNKIDFDASEVTVDSRVDVYGNMDTTKSEAGIRKIPLAATIVTELKAWRIRSKFARDGDLVFPDTKGGYVQHGNMLKRNFRPLLESVAKEQKKFKPFGWHALRHFAISTWIEAGMQPKTIQTFAGHSSLAVTMTRYGHMFPSESHTAAMDKIAASVFGNGA